MPGIEQDVLAAEIVKFAWVEHERNQISFMFFQRFVHQPDGLEERNVYVGSAVKHE